MTPLALDVSRLLWRAVRPAPGGIDRVELAMARHLLREEPQSRFVFTDGGVIRSLTPATVRRLTEEAAARWRGSVDDEGSRRVVAYLASEARVFPPARPRLTDRHVPLVDAGRNLRAQLSYQRRGMLLEAPEALQGAIYVNLSQRNLDEPRLLEALPPGGRMLACLYDAIPLRDSALAAPGSDARMLRMLRHLAARQARLVTISEASRTQITEAAARLGLGLPAIAVVPPPLAEPFLERDSPPGTAQRFFLVPGLLTRRKNLGLLAEACRRLPRGAGFDILLAGAPGLDAAPVLAGLGETPAGIRLLRAEGLSDLAMARLMRGAIAVLAPSLEEGFDYPVHEALALGVPVIASDIPAHREYVAGVAELLDPQDADAWAAALADFATAGPRHAAACAAAQGFLPASPGKLLKKLIDLARMA
ncbi:glycosyltransferase [Roseococcus sp. SDR]|uniref:glycosyltransferase n=1 Tax=Roseococcus sp. SDR TaxID=2835532 RepID=UPI001BCBF2FC|nr:glycosyltransferase [Roseococcus sp. SDR]MBS7791184.1 glycosyltransferase [Roseococcus sp. SDR]MBV1846498.1 glycosyltransferase [Roseococcus sp. SDR]